MAGVNPKHEIRNPKQIRMTKAAKRRSTGVVRETAAVYGGQVKQYDLEERTFQFAKRVRGFVKTLPRTICNLEDVKQLVRASGSVGANYIEANESLGKKDFAMRIKICRKEAKESRFFLRLLDVGGAENERTALIQEATELMNIFGAIVRRTE
jgi:four helix bundle protein